MILELIYLKDESLLFLLTVLDPFESFGLDIFREYILNPEVLD